MTLGESINYYRKKAGLSQEALAEKVGVSRQAVSKWELDEATPEVGKLMALAAAFGITTDQLLSGEVPEEPKAEGHRAERKGPERAPAGSSLPGFLGRMTRRHGWLAGVYIALRGLGITLVGSLARFAFGRMFQVTVDSFNSLGGYGGMSITDASGAPVNLPPEAMEAIRGEIGGGMAMGDVSVVSNMGSIFLGITNVMIVIGVLVMIAGAVLAAVLYRKGRGDGPS